MRSGAAFNGVKVFSATKAQQRAGLGELVTAWSEQNPNCHIVDVSVTQSSDAEFHCLTMVVFYWQAGAGS